MSTFEERLCAAIDEIMHYQTADDGWINTGTLAATLIAAGVVADPVQHQQDLTAIMDRQVRDSEGWRDQFFTGYRHPNDEYIVDSELDATPTWPGEPMPNGEQRHVYHRRVTDWQEVHRA